MTAGTLSHPNPFPALEPAFQATDPLMELTWRGSPLHCHPQPEPALTSLLTLDTVGSRQPYSLAARRLPTMSLTVAVKEL